jgi:hypothetical protein
MIASKKRFHFEEFWPSLEGFQDAVKEAWESVQPSLCPLQTLALKLKATARGLQSWSQRKCGHIRSQLLLAKEIIHQFEIAQETRPLQPNELWLRNMLKKHSLALASLLRTIARLRSRINWLKEGDANSRLFHQHARYRKKKNFIPKLADGDRIITSHEDKAAAVLDFYDNLIGAECDRERTINLDSLDSPSFELESLEVPFSEEVWNTIKELPSDKAPGPDGFTGSFYKSCWAIIKNDVMAAVHSLWSRNFRNLWKLNCSYITLIPKKPDCRNTAHPN